MTAQTKPKSVANLALVPEPDTLGAEFWKHAQERQRRAAERFAKAKADAFRAQMFDGLPRIAQAIDWLERHGVRVLHYENGVYKQPSIAVCAASGFAVLHLPELNPVDQGSSSCATHRRWQAEVCGCYVHWTEAVH